MILSSSADTNRRKHITRSCPRKFMILRDRRRVCNPSNLRLFFYITDSYLFISLGPFFCFLLMVLNIIHLAFFFFIPNNFLPSFISLIFQIFFIRIFTSLVIQVLEYTSFAQSDQQAGILLAFVVKALKKIIAYFLIIGKCHIFEFENYPDMYACRDFISKLHVPCLLLLSRKYFQLFLF